MGIPTSPSQRTRLRHLSYRGLDKVTSEDQITSPSPPNGSPRLSIHHAPTVTSSPGLLDIAYDHRQRTAALLLLFLKLIFQSARQHGGQIEHAALEAADRSGAGQASRGLDLQHQHPAEALDTHRRNSSARGQLRHQRRRLRPRIRYALSTFAARPRLPSHASAVQGPRSEKGMSNPIKTHRPSCGESRGFETSHRKLSPGMGAHEPGHQGAGAAAKGAYVLR